MTLSLVPIYELYAFITQKYGKDAWSWEVETLLLELKEKDDTLLTDKLSLLKIIHNLPYAFYDDPAFFLYACEVINNEPVDFNTVPHITLLEAAWGVVSVNAVMKELGLTPETREGLVSTCAYILRQEGCSEPISPFGFVPKSELVQGQTKEDTDNKVKAVLEYVNHMAKDYS